MTSATPSAAVISNYRGELSIQGIRTNLADLPERGEIKTELGDVHAAQGPSSTTGWRFESHEIELSFEFDLGDEESGEQEFESAFRTLSIVIDEPAAYVLEGEFILSSGKASRVSWNAGFAGPPVVVRIDPRLFIPVAELTSYYREIQEFDSTPTDEWNLSIGEPVPIAEPVSTIMGPIISGSTTGTIAPGTYALAITASMNLVDLGVGPPRSSGFFRLSLSPIPEPSTAILLGLGFVVLARRRHLVFDRDPRQLRPGPYATARESEDGRRRRA